jgi:hypothetical protein
MKKAAKPTSFYSDDEALERAMGKAVREALRVHKLMGDPIVVWRDGRVVWIPPEEIHLPPESNGDDHSS